VLLERLEVKGVIESQLLPRSFALRVTSLTFLLAKSALTLALDPNAFALSLALILRPRSHCPGNLSGLRHQ
jgi:hypothetical protein